MDPLLVGFGFGVGLLVGLTGMGGGSLMTPLLILVVGVKPVIAVGTDIAYAAVTKTAGGLVHLRQRTVDVRLALWMAVGSVPSAVCGVVALEALQRAARDDFDEIVLAIVGTALVLSASAVLARSMVAGRIAREERQTAALDGRARLTAVAVGVAVGFVLGVSSAGSGPLIAVALIFLFRLAPRRVVGTDVVHAAGLLWSVAIAHAVAGNVDYAMAGTILVGSIPGVMLGSRLCVKLPVTMLRLALGLVILGAGVALLARAGLHVPVPALLILGLALAVAVALREALRRSGGDRLRAAVRLLWPFVRAEWRKVAFALASVLGASGIALLKPWPIKFLVDDVLHVGAHGVRPDASAVTIAAIAGAVVAIAALQGLLGFAETFFLAAAGQRIAFRVRSALFGHLHRLPLAFHDRQRTGDLVTRVTSDVTRVQELVMDDLLVVTATRIFQVTGMLVVMLVIDWRVGLVAMLSAPLTLATSAWFRRRIRAGEGHVRAREGDIASMAQETISSIRVVKAFGRQDHESGRFEATSGDMMQAAVRVARLEAAFGWALTVAAAVSLAAVIAFGAHRVIAGALSAGTLIVFIQYMRDLQSPLSGLSRLTAKLARASVRAERILEVLEEPLGTPARAGAKAAGRLTGAVHFDGVTFGYRPDRPVLRDIDLAIDPGEVVAVVGPSGAGKSTLASLLLALYDPDAGAVRVDGQDLRSFTVESYVAQTAVVLQESLLFRASIRENIAYGRPDASLADIRRAAQVAHADEFVRALPAGYDTVVGERGATLSGGQRQRIAIARAVIRNAPILVLDEPTTGLDAEAEAVVLDALERLMEGRTTLLIAHKLATVRRADRIAVLDAGRIVEHDARDVLLAAGGRFAGMAAAQSGVAASAAAAEASS